MDPVWCVDSNAWIRFNIAADGRTTAQIAHIIEGNTLLTQPWQDIASGTWHVFRPEKSPPFQHDYFSLHEERLYYTTGVINTATQMRTISYFCPTGQQRSRINPFNSYSFPQTSPTANFHPPLPPEQVAIKWNELRQEIYQRHVLDVDNILSFDQRTHLIGFLPQIHVLNASTYASQNDYLAALHELIRNKDNESHRALQARAAQTVYDPDIATDPVTLTSKKTFFFDLLKKTYYHIRQQFSAAPLPHDLLLPEIKTAVATAQQNYARWYNTQSTHGSTSFFNWFYHSSHRPEQERMLRTDSSLRGANGFFSWLRHGSYGQNRAITLNQAISITTADKSAIDLVNTLLTDKKTAYNRHSFASFLLDALKDIHDSPWSGLAPHRTSKMYDKHSVIAHLSPTAVATKCPPSVRI